MMAKNTLFNGDAYWNDSWVQELDGDEERLYHFYITSPNLDKSGVYKQPERLVEFYVRGLGIEKIREITEKFSKAKKVIRCGEWIIVPTSLKHQTYQNNHRVIASVIDYLKKIPDEVFEALRECDYPLDLNAIRPPKNVKTDKPYPAADSLSQKPDSLSQKPDESNLIKSNLTESNINLTLVDSSSREEKPPPVENLWKTNQPTAIKFWKSSGKRRRTRAT
jgi:hypothetical protein